MNRYLKASLIGLTSLVIFPNFAEAGIFCRTAVNTPCTPEPFLVDECIEKERCGLLGRRTVKRVTKRELVPHTVCNSATGCLETVYTEQDVTRREVEICRPNGRKVTRERARALDVKAVVYCAPAATPAPAPTPAPPAQEPIPAPGPQLPDAPLEPTPAVQ